jgi:hypothetical protein
MSEAAARIIAPTIVQLYALLYRAGIVEVKISAVCVDAYGRVD